MFFNDANEAARWLKLNPDKTLYAWVYYEGERELTLVNIRCLQYKGYFEIIYPNRAGDTWGSTSFPSFEVYTPPTFSTERPPHPVGLDIFVLKFQDREIQAGAIRDFVNTLNERYQYESSNT